MARTKTRARTYGERIIGSLQQAVDIKRGTLKAAAITQRRATARTTTAPKARAFTGSDIRKLRATLALSQPVFAQGLNVSPDTVRAWEQGKKTPGGPAARLLEIVKGHPSLLLESLRIK